MSLKAKNIVPKFDDPTVLYIVGRGHSGSTLLELLLNRNAHIGAMGELSLFNLQLSRDENSPWIGRCSCSKMPADCEHWLSIINTIKRSYGADLARKPFSWRISDVGREEDYGWCAFPHQVHYLLHRLIRRAVHRAFKNPPRIYRAFYGKWFRRRAFLARAFAHELNVPVVVDASKDPEDMLDFYFLSGLRVKVLFITRDVRGVAASNVRRHARTAIAEARRWTLVNRRTLKALESLPRSSWMQVKYEDLCADPERLLSSISEFSGVKATFSEPSSEFTRRHTIAGNDLRFKEIREVSARETWNELLGEKELLDIRKVSGDCSRRLGYD